MKKALLGAVLLAVVASAPVAANAPAFDGITILDFPDQDGQHAIMGRTVGSNPSIVIYVAGNGTYASLGDGRERACVAWAQEGSYTGTSITFGVPPTEQNLKLVHPGICQPFTLHFESAGTVRVEAENKAGSSGPLAKDAQTIRYSRRHKIIARVPLSAVDWGLPMYATHSVKGVRLGPLPTVLGSLDGQPKVQLSPLEKSYRGVRKLISISRTPHDIQNSTTVGGHVAAAEVMGWPWDVLYGAWYTENMPQRSENRAFDAAIDERYGKPTLKELVHGSSDRIHFWLYDMSGRRIGPNDASPANCLATKNLWQGHSPLAAVNVDIGPWGCALILRLQDDGNRGLVSRYQIEAMSGYTAALNHFFRRLDELRTIREKIKSVQSRPVKL